MNYLNSICQAFVSMDMLDTKSNLYQYITCKLSHSIAQNLIDEILRKSSETNVIN